MAVATLAPAWFLMLLLLSGSPTSLPLSLPPLPEDPVLASVAPDPCIWYMSLAGVDQANPASKNQVEQLLAEDDVKQFVRTIVTTIKAVAANKAANDSGQKVLSEEVPKLIETLLMRPMCAYVGGIAPGAHGPTIRGGVVVNLGDNAAATQASLEKLLGLVPQGAPKPAAPAAGDWNLLPLPQELPPVQWGIQGKYLVIGIGDGEAAALWGRHKAPSPAWLTELKSQLKVERPSMVQYVNLQVISAIAQVALTASEGPERSKDLLTALGLTNATSYSSVCGLEKDDFACRTLLATDGPPVGVLSLVSDKPLDAQALSCIPADASFVLAARADPNKILEAMMDVTMLITGETMAQVELHMEELARVSGVHVRNEIAANLGDTWCIYNAPSDGGLVFTGLTIASTVRNRDKLVQANDKLVAFIHQQEARVQGQFGANFGPTVADFEYRGQKIFFLNFAGEQFPFAPTWCISDKHFIFALFPQTVKAFLDRQASTARGAKTATAGAKSSVENSLASVPKIAAQFSNGPGPTALAYQDTPSLFKLAYPMFQILAQLGFSEAQREGIDLNISMLPGATSILPHLTPSICNVRSTKDGIQIESHGPIPVGLVGVAPVGAMVFGMRSVVMVPRAVALQPPLPVMAAVAVQPLRQVDIRVADQKVAAAPAADRTASTNNLKQIALAMHNYLSANKAFPAAFTTNSLHKPLLSWRVSILPFIEQKDLFDQFHLNEPWDSPDNKKLIEKMPDIFKAPGSKAASEFKTVYLAPRGENTAFPGEKPTRIKDIIDGTSNTIMVVEGSDDKAVIWTKPDDVEVDEKNPIAGLVGLRDGGFLAALCDGSVRMIRKDIDSETLLCLFLRNDGKAIDQAAIDGKPRPPAAAPLAAPRADYPPRAAVPAR